MNHPIHPEDVTFAGLVMGREAVTVAPALPAELPSLIIDAEAAKYFTKGYNGLAFAFTPFARAIIAADREWRLSNAQAALAAPAAAQQEPVAWIDEFGNAFPLAAYRVDGKPSWTDAHKRNWKPLYTHPAAAQNISAWLHTGELGKCWATIGPSGSSNPEALYLHPAAAQPVQPVQPAVPVTDAELLAAGSELSNIAFNLARRSGSILSDEVCKIMDESQKRWDAAVVAAGRASRGQA